MAWSPHRGAGFGLSEGIDDLLFREFRPLLRSAPFVEDRRSCLLTLVLSCRRFQGETSYAPPSHQQVDARRIRFCTTGVLYGLILGIAAGCTNYYRVTDPAFGKSYYTTIRRKFPRPAGPDRSRSRDAKSRGTITLQSSEVEEISHEGVSGGNRRKDRSAEIDACSRS